MKKAIVFNIQKYSIHDGGGIRTIIFFKGCPLRCPWCSNPESQSPEPEMMRKESLCINCSSDSCFTCRATAEDCPTGALETVGREMTVEELLREVKKDMVFYDSTGGGVTLSGGEPLSQGTFAVELLRRLQLLGIDTAIETTGFGNWETLDKMSDYLNRVLFDLKIMDRKKAKDILKADIDIIKNNFSNLVNKGVPVIPRIPLIPGFTTDEENIDTIIDFITSHKLKEVHILPFHQYGSSKYKALGRDYSLASLKPLTQEEIAAIQRRMEERGLTVIVGGK